MSGKADNFILQLKNFGLSDESGRVYLELLKKNRLSALQLSKQLKIARTKVYRLLEKLIQKGLVVEEVKGYGSKFAAQSPEKFLNILNDKERELLVLKTSAPTLINQLNNLRSFTEGGSRILHYRGVEGLRQVTWNTTKTQGTFRIYEYGQSMNAFLDEDFSEKVRRQYTKSPQNEFRQLTNFEEIGEFTQVSSSLKQWKPRFISQDELQISFEIMIYNDVYCMYEYVDNDVFIVEIYNQNLADFQKQIFDLIWNNAKPMKILNKWGKAKVV